MSIGRSMWVSCDGDETVMCDNEVALMGYEATIGKVRAEARRQGWVLTASGLDLCPEHAPAPVVPSDGSGQR